MGALGSLQPNVAVLRLSRAWCTSLFVIFIIVAIAALASAEVDASERIAKLHAAAQRRGLAMLRFNDARIDELVKQPYERDYALVLLFSTNDPKCEPCRYAEYVLGLVKQGYDAGAGSQSQQRRPVYFAELWPHTSPQAYEMFGVDSVPAVAFVASGDAWNLNTHFALASNAEVSHPDKLASWLSRMTGERISAPKTHWMVTNAVPLVIIALCALFFAYHWRDLVVIMQIPMFWFIAAMSVYAFTMSGMHWNMIRGAPLVALTRSGGIQLFRGGYSQTIVEGLIMAALFIGGGMTWVALTVQVPREQNPGKRVLRFSFLAVTWTMIWCWTTVIYTLTKNQGYAPVSYALS